MENNVDAAQKSGYQELEKLFLALSDKTRLRLIALMVDGPVSVGFLTEQLNESQPKVSRHLAYLRSAEVVYTRRYGKWIYYGIAEPSDAAVWAVLDCVMRALRPQKTSSNSPQSDAGFSSDSAYQDESMVNIYGRTYINELDSEPIDSRLANKEELEIFLL